jgi:hypothetical protein
LSVTNETLFSYIGLMFHQYKEVILLVYGHEQLDAHQTLLYGLSKEFVEGFQIRYRKIELPLAMNRMYQLLIKPYIEQNINNPTLIQDVRKRTGLITVKDVKEALARPPKPITNFYRSDKHRTILLPGRFFSFANHRLRRNRVVFLLYKQEDRTAVEGVKMPPNFKVIDYNKLLKRQPLHQKYHLSIRRAIHKLLINHKNHPVFSRPDFPQWMYEYAIKSAKAIDCLEKLVTTHRIGVIIDQTEIIDPPNTLSLIACKYNIPFVNLPLNMVTDKSLLPTRATHYGVWGNHYRDWHLRRGIPSSKIRMIGNLKFEYELKKTKRNTLQFRERHGLTDTRFIVVYTTQPYTEYVNEQLMRWVASAARRLENEITILIKPHPSTNEQDLALFYKYTSNNLIVLPKQSPLYEILQTVDCVMTLSSGSAVEGAIFNKGIIALKPKIPYYFDRHNNGFDTFLVQANAGLIAEKTSDLINHLESLVNNESARANLKAKSKTFLKNTLHTTTTPSLLAYRLIQSLLNGKGRVR